eukprot:3723397-Rhodomonas_salina.4
MKLTAFSTSLHHGNLFCRPQTNVRHRRGKSTGKRQRSSSAEIAVVASEIVDSCVVLRPF